MYTYTTLVADHTSSRSWTGHVVLDWCVISALAGDSQDDDGSGDVHDGKEADQHLTTNYIALQKTVYIASTTFFVSNCQIQCETVNL